MMAPRRTVVVDDLVTLEVVRNVETACVGLAFIDDEGNFVYDSRKKRAISVSSHHYTATAGDAPRRSVDITDIPTLEALRNVEMAAHGRISIDEEGNLCYASRNKRQL